MVITKEYFTQKMAVFHCETEEIANVLLKIAHSFGLEWISSGSYLDTNYWCVHKNETCYNLSDGTYADTQCYISDYYTIIDASKLIAKHKIELFNANN